MFSTVDLGPNDKTPSPWPINGYAPGGYVCKCCHCERQFQGDKKAVACLECAVDLLVKHIDNLERSDG